jgi:glyoxylase-like metal-dependent hydrolase (beta-lactamase superfamily II)
VDRLTAELDEPPRDLLLTHIHFDHAGAAGALVQRWPHLLVHVHPRGARHLADPSRLTASARRVYGDDFDRLFGDVVPIPVQNLRPIEDGERIGRFTAAFTPGHASHHVAFLEEQTGRAYTGDVTGVRLAGGLVFPPTPPPDIDVDLWRASLDRIAAWRPVSLGLPHFGPVGAPEAHLSQVREHLGRTASWARHGEEFFKLRCREWMLREISQVAFDDYCRIALVDESYHGLARWLERSAA